LNEQVFVNGFMKRDVQIYHHLGLGDHIICNGLLRELSKNYERVYCFVKNHNLNSVSFMYRDEPKIELVGVEDDWEVPHKLRDDIDLIKIGFEHLQTLDHKFDVSFYNQIGLSFNLRWDSFYVERDHQAESQLLRELNPNSEPYEFVHDDPSRGLYVDLSLVGKDLKIIRPADSFVNGRLKPEFERFNLFHWIQVLETAQEIHCMDSSFKCLVESLRYMEQTKLFFHRYIRGKGARAECTTRQKWVIIKTPSLGFMAQNSIRRVQSKIKKYLSRVGRPRGANKLTNSPPTVI
jgi:hypothetical protein